MYMYVFSKSLFQMATRLQSIVMLVYFHVGFFWREIVVKMHKVEIMDVLYFYLHSSALHVLGKTFSRYLPQKILSGRMLAPDRMPGRVLFH